MRALRWLLLCTVLAGCGPQYVGVPVGDRSARPAQIPGHHQVRRGDTLYSIAFLYGVSVQEVAAWNDIRPPFTIFRGQQLRLTPPPVQARARAAAPPPPPPASRPKVQRPVAPAPSRPKTAVSGVRASQPKTAAVTPAKVATPAAAPAATPEFAAKPVWGWPADGRVIRRYDANSTGKKGIDIDGRAGDPVRAAAAGKIVYAGSGLSGYGRLIIIKHNDDFLSAYAHNRELLATEGQWVKQHEVIAQMGSSGSDRTALHFEIRKRGRPVNPLEYLPKK